MKKRTQRPIKKRFQKGGGFVFPETKIDPGHEDVLNNGYPTSIPLNRYETENPNDPTYNRLNQDWQSGLQRTYNPLSQRSFDDKSKFMEENKPKFINDLRNRILNEDVNSNSGFKIHDDILTQAGFQGRRTWNINDVTRYSDDLNRINGNLNFYNPYLKHNLRNDLYKDDELSYNNGIDKFTGITQAQLDLPIPMLRGKKRGNINNIRTGLPTLESYKGNIQGVSSNLNPGTAKLSFQNESPTLNRSSMNSIYPQNYPFSNSNTPNILGTPTSHTQEDYPIHRGNNKMESIFPSQSFLPEGVSQFNPTSLGAPIQRIGMTSIPNPSSPNYKPNIIGQQTNLQQPFVRPSLSSMQSERYPSGSKPNILGVPTSMRQTQVVPPAYTTHPIEVYDKRGKFLRKEFIGNDKGVVDHKYIGHHHYAPRGGNSYIDTTFRKGGLAKFIGGGFNNDPGWSIPANPMYQDMDPGWGMPGDPRFEDLDPGWSNPAFYPKKDQVNINGTWVPQAVLDYMGLQNGQDDWHHNVDNIPFPPNNWFSPMLPKQTSIYGQFGQENNIGVLNSTPQNYNGINYNNETDSAHAKSSGVNTPNLNQNPYTSLIPEMGISLLNKLSYSSPNSYDNAQKNFYKQKSSFDSLNKNLYSTNQDLYGRFDLGGEYKNIQNQYEKSLSLINGLNSGGDEYDQEYASYVSQKLPKLQSSMQTLEEQMRNIIREEEMSRFKQDVISSIPKQEAAIYEYTPQNFEITDDMYDSYNEGDAGEYTSPYGIPSPNIGFAKPTSLLNNQQQMDIIRNTALKYNIPPEILAGVYGAETSYGRHSTMRSSAGAQGPFQFMPSTAKQYGIDPWNFNQASDGAARYLANSFKKTGNWADAVASYNAGLGNVKRWRNIPETASYVPKVFANARSLKGKFQQGGKINDDNGYLNSNLHNFTPHKIINSSHITTNNMAFPIKANGKVLFPNTGDYIFPQNKVLEVPLFQKGGVKKGYVYDPSSLPPAPSYNNLAQTSYNIIPVYQPVAKNIQVGSQQPIVTPSVVKRKGLRPVIYPQTPIVQLPPLEYNNLNNSSYQEVTPTPFISNEAFQTPALKKLNNKQKQDVLDLLAEQMQQTVQYQQTPQYNFLNNKNIINNPFLKSLSRKDRIIASLTSPKFRNNA